MSNTSIQVAPLPPANKPSPPVQQQRDWLRFVKKTGQALASLRLTVILFVLSMLLVFTGTLAMRDGGLWATLAGFFRCWIAWIPLQVFVPFGQVFFGMPMNLRVPGGFYYPGGWLLGTALLFNLLAAHTMRFKVLKPAHHSRETNGEPMSLLHRIADFILYRIAWKRSGILMIHSGLVILMLGEFITGKFASEALMPIIIGESSNYLQQTDRVELAFIQDDPKDAGKEHVIVVPDHMLRTSGTIDDAQLPFTLKVDRFLANTTNLRAHRPGDESPATRGEGIEVTLDERPPNAGAVSNETTDTPATYITLLDKQSGASLGTYLLWVYLNEQEIVGGDHWRLALRYQRSYQPYRIYLEEFHHDVYPGTDIPKNFSSRVRVIPDEAESREAVIYMNNPLRYEKQTFYQSGTLKDDVGTVLQVVKNPGAEMPYIACALVCLGMLVHFGMHLGSFLDRRTVA